ncbi:MAG: ester cyclase [Thermoleophilia bacterium]
MSSGRGMKAVVMRIFENLFNEEVSGERERIIDPQVLGRPMGGSGPHETLLVIESLRRSFPDLRFEVDDMIAEGDQVCALWTMTGTHLGQFLSVAPTGRTIRVSGVTVFELPRGRWRSSRGSWDLPHALAQLGAPVPGMGPGPAPVPSA